MMRMVIAHEVGHALGFPHNMAASYAYPVDSLRNGNFTQKNGIAASIMDYARFNYIAQPEDENIRFVRQMGPYDHYVTNWGYRYLNTTSPEAEVPTLNQWILEKADDPTYKYGRQSSSFDPQSQTEGLGDDPIKASTYGLKNLKYVAENLTKWTSDETNNYDDLEELYGELLSVYGRYIGHVTTTIGGVYENLKTPTQEGVVYTHLGKASQKKSIQWLQENVFNTPHWLIDKAILQNIAYAGYFEGIRNAQARHLNALLNTDRLGRLIDAETTNKTYYSALEMLSDVRKGLWKEAYRGVNVDIYRRNLQRTYLERMALLLNTKTSAGRLSYNVGTSDVGSLVRGELKTLRSRLKLAKSGYINTTTRYHYEDAIAKIDTLLDPK